MPSLMFLVFVCPNEYGRVSLSNLEVIYAKDSKLIETKPIKVAVLDPVKW
jgi:hypothetical protein